MPTADGPKPMHVRRTILCLAALCLAALCLAATFLWATHDPNMASGQSCELMEADNSYTALYQQGRDSEAEPYAKKALGLGKHEFGPDHPTTATLLNDLAALYTSPRQLRQGREVASNELTRNQKIENLRRWKYDAHQLEVADEEAEIAVRRPEMFDRVVQALHMLDVDRDTEHTPPTK